MAERTKRVGRKLLVASLGVATLSYGGCGKSLTTADGAADATRMDAGADRPGASTDAKIGRPDTSADTKIVVPDAALDRHIIANLAAP